MRSLRFRRFSPLPTLKRSVEPPLTAHLALPQVGQQQEWKTYPSARHSVPAQQCHDDEHPDRKPRDYPHPHPLARFYQGYWDNLLKLNYPHELITLGFIIPKNREGNAATAALQEQISKTQTLGPESKRFASIIIERQDFPPPLASQDEAERHKLENQRIRRAAMSRARNSLLFTTLGPSTSWVLWLDADIIETPPSLIQDLALHDKPIIVPNCFQRYINPDTKKLDERPYDFNSWQDSEQAQQLAKQMGPDDILVEGYSEMPTYRALMAYQFKEGEDISTEMALDGVGGTALLVKADVHRDGAMFPPFAFYHLIETEGFAKMARRLGWLAFGLPNYKIYHYNE
ncbi:Golgi mannosyltransferase complex subunit [Pseudogymnoascus australis]